MKYYFFFFPSVRQSSIENPFGVHVMLATVWTLEKSIIVTFLISSFSTYSVKEEVVKTEVVVIQYNSRRPSLISKFYLIMEVIRKSPLSS